MCTCGSLSLQGSSLSKLFKVRIWYVKEHMPTPEARLVWTHSVCICVASVFIMIRLERPGNGGSGGDRDVHYYTGSPKKTLRVQK